MPLKPSASKPDAHDSTTMLLSPPAPASGSLRKHERSKSNGEPPPSSNAHTLAASSDDAIATAAASSSTAATAAAAPPAHTRGASEQLLSGSELASMYKAGAADARAQALQHRAHKRAGSTSVASGGSASGSDSAPTSGLHSRSTSAVQGAMDAISRLAANINYSRQDSMADAHAERLQLQLQAAAQTQQLDLDHPDRIDEEAGGQRAMAPLHVTPPTRSIAAPPRPRPHRRGLSENFLSSQKHGGSVMDLFSFAAQPHSASIGAHAPPPSATSTSPSSASSIIQRSNSSTASTRSPAQPSHLVLPLASLPSGLHLRNKSVGSATAAAAAAAAIPAPRSNPASSRFGTIVAEMLKQRQAAAAAAAEALQSHSSDDDAAVSIPLDDPSPVSAAAAVIDVTNGAAALVTPTPIPEMSPAQSPTAHELASSLFNGLASPTTLSRMQSEEATDPFVSATDLASPPPITLDTALSPSSSNRSSGISLSSVGSGGGGVERDLTAALMQSSPRHHALVLRPAPQTIGMLSALRQEQRRQQRQIHEEMKAGGPPMLTASSSLSLDARLAHASGGFAGGLHVSPAGADGSAGASPDEEHMPSLSLDRHSISHWPEHVPLFSRHAGQSPSPHAVALLRSKPARRTPLEVCMLACWLGQRSLTGNLLSGLSPEALLRLAARAGYEKVPVSSFIAREGQESDRVFLLLTGMVSVWERSGAAAALANISINQAAERAAKQAPDQLRVGRKLSMGAVDLEAAGGSSKEPAVDGGATRLDSNASSAASSKRSSAAAPVGSAAASPTSPPLPSSPKPLLHSASSSATATISSTSLASHLTPAVQYPTDMPLDLVRESMFLIRASESGSTKGSSGTKGLRFLNLVGVGHQKASAAQTALALAMAESKQRIILENEGAKTLGAYTAHAEPNAHLAFAQPLAPSTTAASSGGPASSSYVPVLSPSELRKHEEYLSHVNGDMGFANQFADLSRLARSNNGSGNGSAHTIHEEHEGGGSNDEAPSVKELLAVSVAGAKGKGGGAGSSAPLLHAPCPVLGLQGVLFGSRRSASVVTEELCEFLTLPRWIVEAVGLGRMLRQQLAAKIALVRDRVHLFRKYRSPDHPLYQAVEKNVLRLLYYFRLVSASGCIIAQGGRLRHCYFILEGEVEIRARPGVETAAKGSSSGDKSAESQESKKTSGVESAASASSPPVALYTLGPGEVFNEESSFLPPAVFAVSSAQALLHGPHATNPYSAYARSATVILLQIRPAQLRQFLLPALHQDLRALCRLKRGLRADRLLSVAASQRKKMRAEAGVAAAMGGTAGPPTHLSSVTSLMLAQSSNNQQQQAGDKSRSESSADAGASALQSLHPLLPARSQKALLSRVANIAPKPVPAQYAVTPSSSSDTRSTGAGDHSARSLVAPAAVPPLSQSLSAVHLPFVSAQHAASSSLGAGQGNAAAIPLASIIPSLILPVVAPTASPALHAQRSSKLLHHAHSARGPITLTVEEQMAGSASSARGFSLQRDSHEEAGGVQSAAGADAMTPLHPLLQATPLLSVQAIPPTNHQLALPFELTGARPLPESHFSGGIQHLHPGAVTRKTSHGDGPASERSALSRRSSTTRGRDLSEPTPSVYAQLDHSASLSSIGAALSMRNIRIPPSHRRRGGGGALLRGDSKQRRQQAQLDSENNARSVRRERAKLAAASKLQREEQALSLSPGDTHAIEASQAASLAKELSYNVQRAHWGRNALREEDWALSDSVAAPKRGPMQHQAAQAMHAPTLAALTPQAVYHDPFLLTNHLLQPQPNAAAEPFTAGSRDKRPSTTGVSSLSTASSDAAPVLPARSLMLFPTSHDFQSIAQTNHLTRSLVQAVTRSVVDSILSQESARQPTATMGGTSSASSTAVATSLDETKEADATTLSSLPASASSHTRIPPTILQVVNGSARHASLTGGVSSLLPSANSSAARRAEYEELKEMQSAASLLDRPTILAGSGGGCFSSSAATSNLNLYSPKQNTPWRHLMESRSHASGTESNSHSTANSPKRQATVSFEAKFDEAVEGVRAAPASFAPHAPVAGGALVSPRMRRLGSRPHTSEADSAPSLSISVAADSPAAATGASMANSSASISVSQHHLHPSASTATLASSSLSVSPSLTALVDRLQQHVSDGSKQATPLQQQPSTSEDVEWSALVNRNEHHMEIARRLARIKQQQQQQQQQPTLASDPSSLLFAPHLLSSPSTASLHLSSSTSLSTLRDADFSRSAGSAGPAAPTLAPAAVAPRMLHWDAMNFAGAPLTSSASSKQLPVSAAALRVTSSAAPPAGPPALPSWRLIPLHSSRDIGNAFQLAQQREQARQNRIVASGAHTDRAHGGVRKDASTSALHLGAHTHRQPVALSASEAARRFFKLGFPSRKHALQADE